MENNTTTKEQYHHMLNELLEFPPMPEIGEPDMILADGEQWKSDFD